MVKEDDMIDGKSEQNFPGAVIYDKITIVKKI